MKIDNIDVVDATRKWRITVSPFDTKVGKGKDPGACAAAKTLLRMPGVKKVKVHISRTYVLKGKTWQRFNTSPALRTEIISFDRAGIFAPGDYTLDPISPRERENRGKAHSTGAPKHGRPGHERPKSHFLSGVRTHALCGVRSKGKNKVHKD